MHRLIVAMGILWTTGLSYGVAIAPSAEATCPLKAGTRVPALKLKAADGTPFDLGAALAKQKSILIFYRGGWCPYCNIQLGELGRIESTLVALGFQLIAISPDAPAALKESIQKHVLKYQLLSDPGLEAARSFGVAFKDQGEDPVPVPSVFIVDTALNVQFQYSNPDFHVRLNPEILLAVAKSIGQGRPVAALMVAAEFRELEDEPTRQRLLSNEEIYFVPGDPSARRSWTGLAYRYADGKCHFVDEDPARAKPIIVRGTECTPSVRSAALFPYTKIADFEAFRKKLVACLDGRDDDCVRSLAARSVTLAPGASSMGDPRGELLTRLRGDERRAFREAVDALKASAAAKRIEFPDGDRKLASLSGAFELRNGFWLLTSYAAARATDVSPSRSPRRP